MPLSWNEIRHNAIRFAKDWAGVTREESEKQTFWNEFFAAFGINRRAVASFEEPVKNVRDQYGFIDLFWPKVVLVEHKSFGKDLGKAESQAMQYVQDLARDDKRRKEIPRYIIVSDFARIALHDLEAETSVTFPLAELHQRIHSFAFIPGYQQHKFEEQDPINIEATEMLGELHDALEAGGYTGHDLERFLVRILFCLFAEDTGLFQREAFRLYIENRTAEDGSDLGPRLAQLFAVLNTPGDKRQKNLDEELTQFPYVNGDLFSEQLGFAEFNRAMRNALLACTRFDWSRISPAIFGSLFQAVMEPKERRQIGGHYTSERDILKVARSLFLDDLRTELDTRKADRSTGRAKRLEEFHDRLCSLHFLDPACGCGNFLVITYRELRALELETLKELFGKQREFTLADVNKLSQVNVDQFYGIEIGEWPARIAEVALWLMDHQMNLQVSEAFGQLYQRLPLKKSPHIHCANALRLDWKQVLPPARCSYVLGNPPFVGKKEQNGEQKMDMELVCGKVKGSGVLDYVTAWYFKAAEYIRGTQMRVGYVSTNSITQGEQVGVLWNELFTRYQISLHFGHRTFEWESEARGKAHVHVVIIGFANYVSPNKRIYDYEGEKVTVVEASNISPYLVEGASTTITNRPTPITKCPEVTYGSFALDDGHYTLSPEDCAALLRECPRASKYIRRFIGGRELLHSEERFCLWLKDANPAELRQMPPVLKRVEAVRNWRQGRGRETTKDLASTPTLFAEIRQPESDYLAMPTLSSVRRRYIPIAYLDPATVASNQVYVFANASLWDLGILHSSMHMAWVRQVGGRFKSDYRYSASLVYNNYPWPEAVTEKQRAAVERAAQRVLAVRAEFLLPGETRSTGSSSSPKKVRDDVEVVPPKTSTLADLYDPLAMPTALQKAHEELDRAVDKCYRPESFTSERQRVEFLFALYEKLTAPLVAVAKPKRISRKKSAYAQPPPGPPQPGITPEKAYSDAAHHYGIGKEEAQSYRSGKP